MVVGNGWAPSGLPDGVRGVERASDEGIPAGRNVGVPHVRGELLFFLDDDASLADAGRARAGRRAVRRRPGARAWCSCASTPRERGPAARDWVPRLRVGDRARCSDVTHVWEGAVAIPRRVFDEVGGWPAAFRFVHEGVDLGWRVMDAGYRVHYAGDIAALHPPYAPARNEYDHYFGARNRVWLARRYLPWPLGVLYAGSFVLRTVPRLDSGASAARGAARLPRRRARPVPGPAAAERADARAHDAARAAPGLLSTVRA